MEINTNNPIKSFSLVCSLSEESKTISQLISLHFLYPGYKVYILTYKCFLYYKNHQNSGKNQ